ncbi:MAG: hypothetical protein ABL929_00465 [Ferruginibacter sp.]
MSSCTKIHTAEVTETNNSHILQRIVLPKQTNPFSLRNVEKAMASLNTNAKYSNASYSTSTSTSLYPLFVYFKFNPNGLTASQYDAIKADSTLFMLEIPFGNAALYAEDFNLNATTKEQLKDGSVYGVTTIENLIVLNTLSTMPQTIFLDTLVQLPEQDTALQYASFIQAGYTQEQINKIRICRLERPTGFVRYADNDLGSMQPVRDIQVWALGLGVPFLTTQTNNDGYYSIPARYFAPTMIGTMAINRKVAVMPANTTNFGASFVAQFIVGSRHIEGIYRTCQLRDGVDINFVNHTQGKYWSQILNGYSYHYQYTANDNIDHAPPRMICYAMWTDGQDFGNAGMPLLNKIGANPILTNSIISYYVNFPGFASATLTNYLVLLTSHLLPDNLYSIGANAAPIHYESRLAQTIFHELGHASFYYRVGNSYYATLASAEATYAAGFDDYGNADYPDWGKVQVSESWAEYIGTEHAMRLYGANGFKNSDFFGGLVNFTPEHVEDEMHFANTWIPSGIYNDYVDVFNLSIGENGWDNVGGSNIHDMYINFNSGTNDLCIYMNSMQSNYPAIFPTALSYLNFTDSYRKWDIHNFLGCR